MPDSASNTPGLVVPIDVEALCLRPDYLKGNAFERLTPLAQFEDLKVDPDEREHPFISRSALTTAFSDTSKAESSDAGLHLHWALPDALTEGTSSGRHGEPDFPSIPNRWLVVRTILKDGDGSGSISRSAWVVESDYVATVPSHERSNQGAVCVPQPNNPTVWLGRDENAFLPQMYGYIGRVIPLDKWQDRKKPSGASYQEQSYPGTLSALGYGEPAWAALSPASGPTFSFFDAADQFPSFDPSTDTLQYAVVGWYSDGSKDPARNTPPQQVLDDHDWALADQSPPSSFDYSLYHGTVGSIPWTRSEGDPQIPSADTLSISVGNNAPEAISALLAAEHNPSQQEAEPEASSDGLEFWLNALQLGLLDDTSLDDIQDRERIKAKIHAGEFSAETTGQQWTVNAEQKEGKNNDPYAQALQRLNDHQIQLLHDLNQAQRRLNRLVSELQSRRFQVFADWWRYMVAKVDGRRTYHRGKIGCKGKDGVTLCKLFEQLMVVGEGETAKYDDFLNSDRVHDLQPHVVQSSSSPLQKCNQTIQQKRSKLKATLKGTELTLTKTSADPFEAPNDPVVLLKGSAATPPERHGQDGKHNDDGRLTCRLTTNLVSTLEYDGSTSITVKRSQIPGLKNSIPFSPAPSVAESLTRESLLLDASSVVHWANDVPSSEQTAFRQAVRTATEGKGTKQALTISGTLPSPLAITKWSPPWNPILLEWQVRVSPLTPIRGASDTYETSVIETNFSVGHADLNYEQGTPTDAHETYQGRAVLSSGAQSSLKQRLQAVPHLEDHPNWTKKKLKDLLHNLDDASILSQSLGGFHEWMLQKHQTLQIEAIDPENARLTQPLGRAVGTNPPKQGAHSIAPVNTHAPDPVTWFNPIRAGVAEVKGLRLVDTFGQVCEIDLTKKKAPPVHVADALKVPDHMNPPASDGPQIYLPPRLCQASRLNFDWLSADGRRESGSDPASSPICGWVVPVYVTDGLKIFSNDGTPLGTIYAVENNNTPTIAWADAPLSGDAETAVGPQKAVKKAKSVLTNAGVNDALLQFVTKTLANGGDYLQALLKVIRNVHSKVDPGYHQDAPIESLIMGQPLALTRARLSMELNGLRALNQSYEALLDHLQKSYNGNGNSGAQSYEARTSNNFENVRFPVKLGSLEKHYDGLIGYFADGEYDTFHTLADADNSHIRPSTGSGALSLTPTSTPDPNGEPDADGDPSTHPRNVTLLMDPRTKVHATTGVQPVKAVDIPTRHYQPVLRKLKVTVLSSPILSGPTPDAAKRQNQGSGNFGLPLPATKEGSWSWVEQQAQDPSSSVEWSKTPETKIHEVSAKNNRSYPHLSVREGWLLYDRSGEGGSTDGADQNGSADG